MGAPGREEEEVTARRRVPGAVRPEQLTGPRTLASSSDLHQSGRAPENRIPTHLKWSKREKKNDKTSEQRGTHRQLQRQERQGRQVELWRGRGVNYKPQNSHPSKAEERQTEGVKKWRGEEEKTTATELCRGFNQPNYSLITETQNLEQLTHTHTHTHIHTQKQTHIHSYTCAGTHSSLWWQHFTDEMDVAMSDRLLQQHKKKQKLLEGLQQWLHKRMRVVSVIMKEEETLSCPFSEEMERSEPEKLRRPTLILLRRSSKPRHYLGRCATTQVWVFSWLKWKPI